MDKTGIVRAPIHVEKGTIRNTLVNSLNLSCYESNHDSDTITVNLEDGQVLISIDIQEKKDE